MHLITYSSNVSCIWKTNKVTAGEMGALSRAMGVLLTFIFNFDCLNALVDEGDKRITLLKKGDTFQVTCSTTLEDPSALYLKSRLDVETDVLYFSKQANKLTLGEGYRDRVKTDGELKKLAVTINNLTEDDSGVYWCHYRFHSTQGIVSQQGNISVALVTVVNDEVGCQPTGLTKRDDSDRSLSGEGGNEAPPFSLLMLFLALTSISLFVSLTVVLIWLIPKVKKMSSKKTQDRPTDAVYEEMNININTDFPSRREYQQTTGLVP